MTFYLLGGELYANIIISLFALVYHHQLHMSYTSQGQAITEKTQVHSNQSATTAEQSKAESESKALTKAESSRADGVTTSGVETVVASEQHQTQAPSVDPSKKLNFEAKLKQAQLSQSAQPTQAQVNSVDITYSCYKVLE